MQGPQSTYSFKVILLILVKFGDGLAQLASAWEEIISDQWVFSIVKFGYKLDQSFLVVYILGVLTKHPQTLPRL